MLRTPLVFIAFCKPAVPIVPAPVVSGPVPTPVPTVPVVPVPVAAAGVADCVPIVGDVLAVAVPACMPPCC